VQLARAEAPAPLDLQRMGNAEGVPITASCLRAPVDGQALEGLVVNLRELRWVGDVGHITTKITRLKPGRLRGEPAHVW